MDIDELSDLKLDDVSGGKTSTSSNMTVSMGIFGTIEIATSTTSVGPIKIEMTSTSYTPHRTT